MHLVQRTGEYWNNWWNIGGFMEHLAKYMYNDLENTWRNKGRFTEHLVEYRWFQGTLEEYRWMQGTLGEIYVDSRNTWQNIGGFREHFGIWKPIIEDNLIALKAIQRQHGEM
jgi:hypothetical protein